MFRFRYDYDKVRDLFVNNKIFLVFLWMGRFCVVFYGSVLTFGHVILLISDKAKTDVRVLVSFCAFLRTIDEKSMGCLCVDDEKFLPLQPI